MHKMKCEPGDSCFNSDNEAFKMNISICLLSLAVRRRDSLDKQYKFYWGIFLLFY